MTKEREEAASTQRDVSDASTVLGEEMRDAMADVVESVARCKGLHQSQKVKYVGTLEVSICLDRQCAHIIAKCTHQTEIPESEDTVPRKYTKTACEWNEDGTVLTCTFCGVDGT